MTIHNSKGYHIDMKDIIRMAILATKAHQGQKDKGGADYILHPLRVAELVTERFGEDAELIQIALGHDLVEDTNVTALALENAGFSDRVIDGIIALTKLRHEKYDRLKEYRARVFANQDAMKVKWADLTHNMDTSRLNLVDEKATKRLANYKEFLDEINERLGE